MPCAASGRAIAERLRAERQRPQGHTYTSHRYICRETGESGISDIVNGLPPYTKRPASSPTALDGIRILDFSRLIAGPYGTMLLGDLGADVIKIEDPSTGDDARNLQPPVLGGEGALYVWANRNKRSITLNLRLPEGQRIARELAKQCDVVVENYSAGVMKRFGLSYETLSQDNPELIYVAISAFGRQGKFAGRPGYDPVAQAESGLMSITGFPDAEPVRVGAPVVDISSGMMTCNTVLAALMARDRHGIGQYAEVSLFDDAIGLTGYAATSYLMSGEEPTRTGNASRATHPNGVYEAQDGQIFLSCANERNFVRLAEEVVDQPELISDSRFSEMRARRENADALNSLLNGTFRGRPRAYWVEKGRGVWRADRTRPERQ